MQDSRGMIADAQEIKALRAKLAVTQKALEEYKSQAEIYALMLKTTFTEPEIEMAYETVIEVYRKCEAGDSNS